ncbi:MAG: pectin acetylesterase [Bacteroidetes bacterium RBG_13_42_15]|nr:MAG: pectin acetylesterase [Bacteroidetes bacterium RBG_13_42_15]
MKRTIYLFSVLLGGFHMIYSQEFIPLWPYGKKPNSKGIEAKEIIANERMLQVETPGIYAFFTSREENSGGAVLICPSGGYHHLTYQLGGFQLAKWFNTIGMNAFVLIYRLPNSPDLMERHKAPLQDAQRAMRVIRANAGNWNIQTDKIGVMGTSAGGHLATTLATHTEDVSMIGDSLDEYPYHPDFQILISPVITMGTYTHRGSFENLLGDDPSAQIIEKYSNELNVSCTTPPSFLVHAENDKSVSPQNSTLYFQSLLKNDIPVSLHIFPDGGHSIALTNNPGSTQLWSTLCKAWLEEMGICRAPGKAGCRAIPF